ncbi:MAG: hypothetical protein ABH859_08485 [Pseudomonadota bacterium]
MRTLIDHIIFYPAYVSLILFGFFVHKRQARPVTACGPNQQSYIRVADEKGRAVYLGWRDLPVLRTNWRGRLRRYFTIRFRKAYIEKQLAKRKGECQMCGRCCCVRKCPFIIQEGQSWQCILHPAKPANCRIYPINQKDVVEYNCPGFSF